MPTFTMLIGIPGSGKSTWAKEQRGTIISTDAIRHELFGDINDQTRNAEVFDAAHTSIKCHLEAGNDVIFDATNLRSFHREILLKSLPHCKKVALIFGVLPEVAKERVDSDIKAGKLRSAVPHHAIDRMARLFRDEVSPAGLRAEGFDEVMGIVQEPLKNTFQPLPDVSKWID